ncbi:hypothetical protein [Nannocystis punicea]|uniref:Photosynthesis system II assembly factor Ycf48/Hcf136-like domain-containing protein n=1 Tax=Nannocystis punicea TaxID=2995304 RepID=A0ABY7GXI8_9BACT|nr:hypothetical protein [Nannocystis poenicansa]WAS91672.1 hypothetical protein O0S08_36280 [Nannocystis poenicansa]
MLARRACAALLLGACSSAPSTTDASSSTADPSTSTATTTTTAPTTTAESTTAEPAGWSVALELGVDKGALFSVWGPQPDDVIAVGGQGVGPSSKGLALRWDGVAWTELALPPGTTRLHWLAGVGDALWAVGEAGAAIRRDGDAWTTIDTGVDVPLWGIWGAGPDAIWSVGGDGFVGGPSVLRWDGDAWTPESLPPLPEDCHALFKLVGTGTADVTAVGDLGVVLQYDGAAWTQQDVGSIADLISVSGPASARLAVGGRANARLAWWDGQQWTGATLDRPGLSGVWIGNDGAGFITGSAGQILHITAGSLEPEPEASPTNLLLHAAFGFAEGPRFAVGGNLAGMPPHVGVVLQHPGP